MYHNISLPAFLRPFLVTSFGYESISHTSYSGRHYIKNNSEYPIHQFTIKSPRLSKSELQEFYNFFNARKARLHSFKLKDPFDNYLERSHIALVLSERVEGVPDVFKFEVYKQYGGDEDCYTKQIKCIDENDMQIYINGMQINASIDPETQLIAISYPPSASDYLEAQCSFYKIVRFETEKIEYPILQDGS